MKRIPILAALAVAVALPATLSAAPAGVTDISGAWSGSGTVQRDGTSKPINVRCEITGEQSTNTIGFEGVCRALLVVRRPIGATFVIDGERVTGTYTGAQAGVAQLDGRATTPTEWELTMTFPREVNGDNTAMMTIENPGDGTFRIITVDRMVSGDEVTTSDVVFQKK